MRTGVLATIAALIAGCPGTLVVDAAADGGDAGADAGLLDGGSDGGNDAGAPDAGWDAGTVDAGGSPYPPPLVPTQGGPVLADVKLVTVTFGNDPDATLKEDFGDWLVGSEWLAAAEEYGVRSLTHVKKVRVPGDAPTAASLADIRAFIAAQISGGSIPAPEVGSLIALHYPTATLLQLSTWVHCRDFSGYHSEMVVGGVKLAFSAIGACPTYVSGLSAQENMLRTASHEIIEAATDPFVDSAPGFVVTDEDNPWYFYAGEVADICPLSQVVRDGSFLAQRFWSNRAALAGLDPCVPAPAALTPYLTAATPSSTQIIDAGTSVTLTLHSVAPSGAASWSLQARSSGDFNAAPMLDATIVSPGSVSHLTLSVPPGTPAGKYALVPLYSYRSTTDFHLWPVVIEAR